MLALALLGGACSAQPVSEVTDVPQPPTSDAPASAPVASAAPPSEAAPSDATTAPTPAPANAPPGKPTGTTFAIVSEQPGDNGGTRQTHRITWQAADGAASAFLVYGVKDCLRASKAHNGTPCIVKGMKIPRNSLVQLAQAGGADRSIDVDWVVPASGRQPYAAVLLRATNAVGDSIFTIVHSEDVCWGC
jgi:hypothetical protein